MSNASRQTLLKIYTSCIVGIGIFIGISVFCRKSVEYQPSKKFNIYNQNPYGIAPQDIKNSCPVYERTNIYKDCEQVCTNTRGVYSCQSKREDECICNYGYARSFYGRCIRSYECVELRDKFDIPDKPEDPKCPENEFYNHKALPYFEPTCESPYRPSKTLFLDDAFISACECKDDYVRNGSGICITRDMCKNSPDEYQPSTTEYTSSINHQPPNIPLLASDINDTLSEIFPKTLENFPFHDMNAINEYVNKVNKFINKLNINRNKENSTFTIMREDNNTTADTTEVPDSTEIAIHNNYSDGMFTSSFMGNTTSISTTNNQTDI